MRLERFTAAASEFTMSKHNVNSDEKTKKDSWKSGCHRLCFEIEYFARTNGITKRQAAELMKKYGNDYATLLREAKWLRD